MIDKVGDKKTETRETSMSCQDLTEHWRTEWETLKLKDKVGDIHVVARIHRALGDRVGDKVGVKGG